VVAARERQAFVVEAEEPDVAVLDGVLERAALDDLEDRGEQPEVFAALVEDGSVPDELHGLLVIGGCGAVDSGGAIERHDAAFHRRVVTAEPVANLGERRALTLIGENEVGGAGRRRRQPHVL
jgi:hypothetical protein